MLGSARRTLLVLAIPFGLALAFLVPPFQVADESSHFLRAWQIAGGRLVPETPGGVPGGYFPADVAAVAKGYDELRWHSERKVAPSQILADLRRPRDRGPPVFVELKAAAYSPVAYLPQLAGVALGRALPAPALVALYLGRLSSLATMIAVMWGVLSTLPLYRRTFVLLALLPMDLAQWAAVSADGVLIGSCLLFIALVLRGVFEPRRLGLQTAAALLALAIVMALSKPVYLLIAGLVFLLPSEKLQRRWQVALFLLLCVAAVAAARGWALLTYAHGFTPTSAAGRSRLDLVLASPWRLAWMVVTSYLHWAEFLVRSFIGQLGWLDVWLPIPVVVALAAGLLASALGESPSPAWSRWQRALLLALLALAMAAMALALFIYGGKERNDRIDGLQGRYFLPLAPLLLLALAQRRWRWPLRAPSPDRLLAWLWAGGLAVTIGAVINRYYLE
jgi:uncharacterized membrane protein